MNKRNKSVVFSMSTIKSFKLIVVGNKHAGKTSLILRFVKDFFQNNYKVTIGVEFFSKIIQNGSQQISIQIWDTAGSQNYKSVVRSFYKYAHCILIAYENLSQLQTNVPTWMSQIKNNAQEAARVMLVRTKIDLKPLEQQQKRKVQSIVNKYQMDFFMPVSAKTNYNVTELFTKVGIHLSQLYKKSQEFREIVEPKTESILLTSSITSRNVRDKKCCQG